MSKRKFLSISFLKFVILLNLAFAIAVPTVQADPLAKFCNYILSFRQKKTEVQRLLDSHRDQEAIWLLMKTDPEAAKELREQLKEKLLTGKTRYVIELHGPTAMNNIGRAVLDNGISGIQKDDSEYLQAGGEMSYMNEIFASDLDEVLHLNRVPTTVKLEIPRPDAIDIGDSIRSHLWHRSFQVWVKKASPRKLKKGSLEMQDLNEREWNFFQFLVDYIDDNGFNTLYTQGGYRVFIDNAAILTHWKRTVTQSYDMREYAPRREVFERLRDWPESDIRALFAKHQIKDRWVIDAFLFRRNELITHLAPLYAE